MFYTCVVLKCFWIYKIQVTIPWCFIWCVWSPHFDAQLGSCSYVIPISTDFFMCLIFMSNLYQQISYMSHYHVCHTYINEYSMCLLIRIISMSYLYQRIFHVSPRLIMMYVIFTSNLHQQISYMSETGKS